MGKIVAIGGGEMGRPHKDREFYPLETVSIDKEIVALASKKKPRLLFIPTASNDSESYFELIKKYFSKLGCKVDVLYLIREKLSKKEIEHKILSSNIIYVGGGDTLKMMTLWRKKGVDKVLKKAYKKGIVLSGLSAGSICWFSFGNSDSKLITNNSSQLIKVTGLGLVDALHCPHFNGEGGRKKDLPRMMKSTSKLVALALDNSCAIEIVDKKYRILHSKPNAKAYKTYWKKGKYIQEEIISRKEFRDLKELLKK